MTRQTPAQILHRIAFLMERTGGAGYRIKAYRNAARAVSELSAEDLALLAAADTLTDLAGIGPKTASVITDALAGRRPPVLAQLEEDADQPLCDGGLRLRARLRGDLHLHSDWSDGSATITEMATACRELGHEYAVLTDHSPSLKVARGLTAGRLRRQLQQVTLDGGQWSPLRLLRGIECDILAEGELDQSGELLGEVDLVVASVHSKLRMPAAAMTRRMLRAVADPHTDVLGHCTGRLVDGDRGIRPPSEFDAEIVFAECAARGVAVEINSRPERQDPPDELMTVALAAGCLFSIDSDAHAPGQLDWQVYGCARAEANGVPPERIVNTWSVEDLLAWTNDHSHRPVSVG